MTATMTTTNHNCCVCGTDLGWDRPSGVCSEACLRKGQGFPPATEPTREEFAATVTEWETAWAEYIEALDRYDHAEDWCGNDDWIFTVSRLARALKDAKNHLRRLNPTFCDRIGV